VPQMAETRRTTSATHEGPSGPQAAGPAARDRARVRAGYRFLLARGYDLKVIYSPAGRRGECLARPPELSPLQRRIVSPATAAAMRPHALRVARITRCMRRWWVTRCQPASWMRLRSQALRLRCFIAGPRFWRISVAPSSIAKNLKGVTAKTPPSSTHGECSLLAARVFDLLGRGMGMPPGSGLSIKP
jgi:hypothetical protein